jgi:predicted phage tail protein
MPHGKKALWILYCVAAGWATSWLAMRAPSGFQYFLLGVGTGLVIAAIAQSLGQRRVNRRASTSVEAAKFAVKGWDGSP